MSIRRSAAYAILSWLALAAGPVRAIDLVQTYDQAKVSDPAYLATEAKYQADRQILVQARGTLFPNINGSAGITRHSQNNVDTETRGYTLSLTQPVFDLGIFSGVAEARWEVKRAAAEFASAQQDLMLRVAGRYLGALAAQDNLDLAVAERSAISQQLQAAEGRLRAGLGTITEVHDARARFQLSEAKYLEAESSLQDSLDALAELTGELTEALKTLKEEVPTVRPQPENQQQWIDTAQQQNLAIQSKLAAYNAASKRVKVERSGHFPSVDIIGKHQQVETSPAAPLTDGTDNSVGIEMNVPIFQGGIVTSRTRQTKSLREAARQELEAARRSTRRQTRSAYAGIISGIKRVEALQQAVVASESALKAKKTGFEAGINTNLDVLDAQRDLYQAKRDYSQTRYTYILDLLKLKQAAGQLSENDLKEVNGWLQ